MLNSSRFRKLITIDNVNQNAFRRERRGLLSLERKYKSHHANVVNEAKKMMSKYEQLKRTNSSNNDQLRAMGQKARKLNEANKMMKAKLMKWKPELAKRRDKLIEMKKQHREFTTIVVLY